MSSRRRPAPRILWICPPRLMGQPVTYPSQDFSDRIHGISLPRFLSIVHADVTSLSDTMFKYGWADGKLCNQLRRRPSPPRDCSCIHDLTLASMPLCSHCCLSIVGVYGDESTKIAVGAWFRCRLRAIPISWYSPRFSTRNTMIKIFGDGWLRERKGAKGRYVQIRNS